jgi:hypothetical protein
LQRHLLLPALVACVARPRLSFTLARTGENRKDTRHKGHRLHVTRKATPDGERRRRSGVRQLAAALLPASLLAVHGVEGEPRASSRAESGSKLPHSKSRRPWKAGLRLVPGPMSFQVPMGLRPTHWDENQQPRHPRVSGGPRLPDHWIPAPRLRGDKLRGNDVSGVIFEEGLQVVGRLNVSRNVFH